MSILSIPRAQALANRELLDAEPLAFQNPSLQRALKLFTCAVYLTPRAMAWMESHNLNGVSLADGLASRLELTSILLMLRAKPAPSMAMDADADDVLVLICEAQDGVPALTVALESETLG
jgi:hypothetical protein